MSRRHAGAYGEACCDVTIPEEWTQKQHSTPAKIIALVPAGIILLLLLPYWLLVICPSLDESLGWVPPSPTQVSIIVGAGINIPVYLFQRRVLEPGIKNK